MPPKPPPGMRYVPREPGDGLIVGPRLPAPGAETMGLMQPAPGPEAVPATADAAWAEGLMSAIREAIRGVLVEWGVPLTEVDR